MKATTGDSFALLPPVRCSTPSTGDAVGGLYFSFGKYGVQVEEAAFTAGADLAANAPPAAADRDEEVAVSTYNLENLYDFRDDPTDGCDFAGNTGCPGVSPPFDYVPASQAAYEERLGDIADQITDDLHSPDILLTQEAEDQDICSVVAGGLACGGPEAGDGKPDTLQELALAIGLAGGGDYDAAYDRNGADARGIVSAVLFRTDRVSLVPADPAHPVLGATPAVSYRARPCSPTPTCPTPRPSTRCCPPTSTRRPGSTAPTCSPGRPRWPASGWRPRRAAATATTCGC